MSRRCDHPAVRHARGTRGRGRAPGTPRAPDRGVAVLLVLISLATATILATSYLAARDNSAAIGANIADSAEARWASLAGIDAAVAILETETDWRTSHVGGVVLDDHPIGGATVDVALEDRVTGDPPSEDTTELLIRSIASAGGVTQTASAYATVLPDPVTQPVTVDLREFAAFVTEELVLDDNAAIGRWSRSGKAKLHQQVNIGTTATGAGSIRTSGNARTADALLWQPSTASGFMVSDGSDARVATATLPDDGIPMPASPAPSYPKTNLPEIVDAPWTTDKILLGLELWEDAEAVGPYDLATIQATTLVIDDQLGLNGARIRIAHPTEIIVYGDVKMLNATIVIEPGGELDLKIAGQLRMSDSIIAPGEAGGAVVTDFEGLAPYKDVQNVRVWSYDGGSPEAWVIDGDSMIMGMVHAPDAAGMELRDRSALYGRVTAPRIELRNDSGIWYDPKLDDGYGFTNPDSMLYDATGDLKASVKTLGELGTGTLQTLADAINADIKMTDTKKVEKTTPQGNGPPSPPPSTVTPRPVPVLHAIIENGGDVLAWESGN